jgi:hypothetical protein
VAKASAREEVVPCPAVVDVLDHVAAGEPEAIEELAGTSALNVDRAVAPTNAWLVVHLDDNGKPGDRVGLQAIPAGDSRDIKVALDPGMQLTEKLLIAVHADRGTAGTFEFDMMKKLESPDQPFFVDGAEVATAARVR